jgi:HD-GYP domain-containing protein (c-di-GMP phosphodiesterase class II)
VVQLAETVEVHLRMYGVSGALAMARRRSGTQFDPELVSVLEGCRADLAGLAGGDTWSEALRLAPDRDVVLDDAGTDALLLAMGDFVDLKCPFTAGHSRAVAELATAAAARIGLPAKDLAQIRRAGYVHDLGRMGVPNSVWEKPGSLGESDQERIRLYPYLTGRILNRVTGLEPVRLIAEQHRERLDGSGYPRGLVASSLPMTQRVLAAADSYQGYLEERPHRPAQPPADAARRLHEEARAGHLDAAAVDAVLDVAGHRTGRRSLGPSGLTTREVEVLALTARGASTEQIARRLSISSKTVRNHLEHIYAKAHVSNRTGAALFAVEHGLVNTAEDEASAP